MPSRPTVRDPVIAEPESLSLWDVPAGQKKRAIRALARRLKGLRRCLLSGRSNLRCAFMGLMWAAFGNRPCRRGDRSAAELLTCSPPATGSLVSAFTENGQNLLRGRLSERRQYSARQVGHRRFQRHVRSGDLEPESCSGSASSDPQRASRPMGGRWHLLFWPTNPAASPWHLVTL